MAKAIWTGTISFGLVTIPVKLYSATQPRDVRFHEYDRATGRRVHHRRVVEVATPLGEPEEEVEPEAPRRPTPIASEPPSTVPGPPEPPVALPVDRPARFERELDDGDVVKGLEIDRGRQVLISDEELAALRPERSRTIAVEEFVDLADVDPVSFDRSYYVVPQPGAQAERPYGLLLTAMERAGRVAIARLVLRTKEHLVAIRPARGVLMLHTLFFADEVVGPAALPWFGGVAEVPERELRMADHLIGMLAADWDPGRHRDEYRERVLELIASRTPQSVPRSEPEPDVERPGVAELMAALEASVRALKEQRPAKPRRTEAPGSPQAAR
jgi:DNA end-binding protein Ku